MDKAIEAAARIIDPLAFEEQGSCPPRGYECHTPEQLNRVIAARRRHALSVAKRMIAAYQAASGEARDAKLNAALLVAAKEHIRTIDERLFAGEHELRYTTPWGTALQLVEAVEAIDAAIAARVTRITPEWTANMALKETGEPISAGLLAVDPEIDIAAREGE